MKPALVFVSVLFAANLALADGLALENGRFRGPVLQLELNAEQTKIIDQFRTCHVDHSDTMNAHTPYVFALAPAQARAVRRRAGFAPHLFAVYETYRGFNDAG